MYSWFLSWWAIFNWHLDIFILCSESGSYLKLLFKLALFDTITLGEGESATSLVDIEIQVSHLASVDSQVREVFLIFAVWGWDFWFFLHSQLTMLGIVSLLSTRLPLWRRRWHPTPVLLPGKSHGRRSLVGCSPWGRKESDTTERLHFHFSLSCIGEGNGNALQYSCLENPRDGAAWWAAIYGVAQSQTWLKWLSSGSSSRLPLTALQ